MIEWRSQAAALDDVVKCIQSGMNIFIHGAAATPTPLLDALDRRTDVEAIKLFHLHLDGRFLLPHQKAVHVSFRFHFLLGPRSERLLRKGLRISLRFFSR